MNRAVIRDELCRGLLGGLALLALTLPPAGAYRPDAASVSPAAHRTGALRRADFGRVAPGPEARELADWIAASNDNAGAAFAIVDKREATVFVFDAQARHRGSSPALLGSARGDDTVEGIGTRPIALVRPEERTTPAGRFVAERGRNARGEDVVWVDYDAAVSMHRVLTTDPSERRLQRLASPSADDRRISYGCINLPVAFYEAHVRPAFAQPGGVIYVMPESRPIRQVFGSYDVGAAPR
ncbi:hypothetical protein HZ992_15935 [Rhizobacter sp. AJA081-3]|uniref:hypothetical protein n=1 Tax=Rhizobacter sp. AJA081-3 TaxID=2753607 RepID=UPI001ADFDAA7|nr:hypothetical protein [Rhizobacter sp. AJA081-3]QTN21663.1 hypothetical protein HZ992_15935 [Rhizobacter sp. AJA081-3]